ncbi:hypothetical protein GCM10007170_30780 [Arthrobacter liuii]|uniref:YCII-related domain-containing protein n=1 Tax=Arthrobacter liuii TaxID=1476996 RepID=A0ABQ2AUW6_9MICC|nr:hypothetical protein GCM10007170_30780 [Arthrobacter liuii]
MVFYAAKGASRLREVYPRHHAYVEQFARDGGLLAIGTFDDPVTGGQPKMFAHSRMCHSSTSPARTKGSFSA